MAMATATGPTLAEIQEARARLAGVARETPVISSETLGRLSGRLVWLKAENLQRTGSFKIRGAYNRILLLSNEERAAGVVTASAGNHGQAVAWAAREAGVGAELIASVTERCFHYLEAPPQRVTGHDIPYPPAKLEKHQGHLTRSAVELAKDWRADRVLRRLEAMLVIADRSTSLVVTGTGDVLEPEHGIVAIGSGGPYAQAAAKALLDNTSLGARDIVDRALKIAGEICIYTNQQIVIESHLCPPRSRLAARAHPLRSRPGRSASCGARETVGS